MGKAGRAIVGIFVTCIVFIVLLELMQFLINGTFLQTLEDILNSATVTFAPINDLINGKISNDIYSWLLIFSMILFIAAIAGAIAKNAGGGFIAGFIGPLLLPIVVLILPMAGLYKHIITYDYFYTDGLGLVVFSFITGIFAAGVGALGKKSSSEKIEKKEIKPKVKPKPREIVGIIEEKPKLEETKEEVTEEEILEEIEKL